MRRRVVDRALGDVENVLELHGESRGASKPDNRLAHRRQEVPRVELRGEQDLVTLSVLGPFGDWTMKATRITEMSPSFSTSVME